MSRYSVLNWLVGLIVVVGIILMLVLPIVLGSPIQYGPTTAPFADWRYSVLTLQTCTMRLLVVTWLFSVGACFASFLNVVAWRVPRGRGITGSSHCPHCDVKLRMIDNLPVLGWLKNGGRCRDCYTSISPRYLIVELVLGAITVAMFTLEVFWIGINLPGTGQDHRFSLIVNFIAYPRWDLIQTVCFHLVLIYGLFTAAIIRNDRLPVPRSVVLVFAAIGIGMALLPHSHVVDWQGNTPPQMGLSMTRLITVGLGLGSGLLLGTAFDLFLHRSHKNAPFASAVSPAVVSLADGVATLSLVGLFLGWQATVSTSIILLVLFVPFRRLINCRCCPTFAVQVFLATMIQLVGWRMIAWALPF